jgi:hypothetical protein
MNSKIIHIFELLLKINFVSKVLISFYEFSYSELQS